MLMCVCVDMLMTLFVFLPHAHLSSSATCMRCGLDVSPLIGATATSTNEAFFCNESYTEKNGRFSITDNVFPCGRDWNAMTPFH